MDKSEEYARMCICPEVQKQWKLPHDDQDYIYHYRTGFWLNGNQVRPGDRDAGWVADEKVGFMNGQLIWLPRQDQIQEMMGVKTASGFRNKVDDMFYTRDGGLYDTMNDEWFVEMLKTPEQLWLAFYMFENHQKIWDGEQWVKSVKE